MKTLAFLALLCASVVHADDPRIITQPVVIIGAEQLATVYTIHGADSILHCDLEPVVKKEGNGWVITFKPKAEGK